MSQTCPRCRLISPDEAIRCDCGYDFATGKIERSYFHDAEVARQGGAAKFYRAEARRNLWSGIAALCVAVLFSVATYVSTGRIGIAFLPMFGALIWILRAYRFNRESTTAGQSDRDSNPRRQ